MTAFLVIGYLMYREYVVPCCGDGDARAGECMSLAIQICANCRNSGTLANCTIPSKSVLLGKCKNSTNDKCLYWQGTCNPGSRIDCTQFGIS